MGITAGTNWYAPVDFGFNEWLSRKVGQPIGYQNPLQSLAYPNQNALNYDGAAERAKETTSLIQNGFIGPTKPTTTQQQTTSPSGFNPTPQTNNTGQSEADWFAEQVAAARRAAEEGRRRADEAFQRSRGIFDEGMGLLGQRRNEFQEQFNQGQNDILGGYQQGRGQLQASAQNAAKASANAMRAMGIGGPASALLNNQGRRDQMNMEALSNLQRERALNDRQNTSNFNENKTWANTQEAGLNRYLQDADSLRRNTENDFDFARQGAENDIRAQMNEYVRQIQAQNNALEMAKGNIGGFQAPNLNMVMSNFSGALDGAGVPQMGGGQQGQNAGVSIDGLQATLAKLLGRR